MKVYYASLTGNVRRFISKLDVEAFDIMSNPVADADFVLITYTFGFGEVPKEVTKWLQNNSERLRGVVVSGNRNWGTNFGKAGDIISKVHNVPLLHKFELGGNADDVSITRERMKNIALH